jgi:hypothetical protein
MNIPLFLLALLISSAVMTIYYFGVKDKISSYNDSEYYTFLITFILILIIITVILYLFIKTILNSKQIYPRSVAGKQYRKPLIVDYQSPESIYETSIPKKYPSFNDTIFNKNFTNLFRRSNAVRSTPNDVYIKSRYQGNIRPPSASPNIFWE